MKKLKFRVWFEGVMIYSDCPSGEYEFTFDENGEMVFNVWNDEIHKLTPDGDVSCSGWDTYTKDIMQYIGRNDKNGVEIYERDIINTPNVPTPHHVHLVNERFELKLYGSLSFMEFTSRFGNIEVIGNLDANPEIFTRGLNE